MSKTKIKTNYKNMYSQKTAKKLGYSNTIDLKYILSSEYVNKVENKGVKNKAINLGVGAMVFLGFGFIVSVLLIAMLPRVTFASDDVFDAKIEKFCEYYGEKGEYDKKLINRCAKIGKAQMRFELGSVCEGKEWNNNCFNFRAISKYNRLDEFNILGLDKAGFTIFEDKSSSLKYFAYRFYKYDRKKSVREIVMDFTHSQEDWDNYENFILNYKD